MAKGLKFDIDFRVTVSASGRFCDNSFFSRTNITHLKFILINLKVNKYTWIRQKV